MKDRGVNLPYPLFFKEGDFLIGKCNACRSAFRRDQHKIIIRNKSYAKAHPIQGIIAKPASSKCLSKVKTLSILFERMSTNEMQSV